MASSVLCVSGPHRLERRTAEGNDAMSRTKSTAPLSYGVPPPAFRLPDASHVGTVHLQVADLQRSLAYYEQVLGLRAQDVTGASAVLSAHHDERPLVTLHTRRGISRARRGAFGLYHFAVLLPERSALGRFAAHLMSFDVRPGMADHLVSEALYLWDPDGLGIEVYVDRPRDTWQQHDRELAMTTDPLDIQSVIAAGRGEAWTGTPVSTTIGHVHLHVGSLEQAEAFYHRGLGLDKTVWSYPGALFMSAGGYHHHLGTNVWSTGPSASTDEARLVEWELIVPSDADVEAAALNLREAGYSVDKVAHGVALADPWGTRLHIRPER
jgi:catechol 2,3-dioxygenase